MDETVKLKAWGTTILTPMPSNILNPSKTFVVSQEDQGVLERGLSFILTPLRLDKNVLKQDLYEYHRHFLNCCIILNSL